MDDDGTTPNPAPRMTPAPGVTPTPTSTTATPFDPTDLVGLSDLTETGRSFGRPVAWLSLGVLLFLLAVAGWWTQDAIGTVVNVGEADMGETITFTSDGGSYRLLSSGPLRPPAESTWCQLTYADESTRREVGGQGLQTSRLGVDRLLTFEPPAGRTTVRCTNRSSAVVGNGRFQVLDADGPFHDVLIGVFVGSVVFLALGIAGIARAYRRASALTGAGPGAGDRTPGLPAMFDPGGFVDEPIPDEGPDED